MKNFSYSSGRRKACRAPSRKQLPRYANDDIIMQAREYLVLVQCDVIFIFIFWSETKVHPVVSIIAAIAQEHGFLPVSLPDIVIAHIFQVNNRERYAHDLFCRTGSIMPDSILEHFKDICRGSPFSGFPVFNGTLRDVVSLGEHFLCHIQFLSHFFYSQVVTTMRTSPRPCACEACEVVFFDIP